MRYRAPDPVFGQNRILIILPGSRLLLLIHNLICFPPFHLPFPNVSSLFLKYLIPAVASCRIYLEPYFLRFGSRFGSAFSKKKKNVVDTQIYFI